jgi:hypothetical protein
MKRTDSSTPRGVEAVRERVRRSRPVLFVLGALLLLSWAAGARGQLTSAATGWKVIGWNNLGMHCDDADYAVFSTLPPFNTVVAQVIDATGRRVTSPAGVTVTYEAVADPWGSIDTTSQGKTNFWDRAPQLFRVRLPVDVGLAGFEMPGPGNAPQAMTFDPAYGWFIATGIPITPYDDARKKNYYPMMRLSVRGGSGELLASTDVVLPVSDEMDCRACHSSGSGPAAQPVGGWVGVRDPERDFRLNILRLHDERQLGSQAYTDALAAAGYAGYGTPGLYGTVIRDGIAILCARCHPSEALGGGGVAGVPPLTRAIHGHHAGVVDPATGMSMGSSDNRSACYRCHPGSTTRCLRGAMGRAVAADGTMAIQCQSCHGTMGVVGAATRTGWLDEPNCQACHTGTALVNSGQIRFTSALTATGQLRQPADRTFATTPDEPAPGLSLYRFSSGHGGLQCEACHGATHAEYPTSHRSDNVQSVAFQGHAGAIGECAACHGTVPATVNGGPHGMHPVGQAWIERHPDVAEGGGASQCRACHGGDYRGTVLSRVFADRTLTAFGPKPVWRGFQVGCYTCHNGPSDDSASSNAPPTVADVPASTAYGVPVGVELLASDANADPLTLRVVSQPAGGTVALSGTLATYRPFAGFSGADSFTYAAGDGSADSNLGHVAVTVSPGTCTLPCNASAPAAGNQGSSLLFFATATPSDCTGVPGYSWSFGDASPASSSQNPTHVYEAAGAFHWTMTAQVGATTCTRSGDIAVSPPGSCAVWCSAMVPARGSANQPVAFQATASAAGCGSAPRYRWSFGDRTGSTDPVTTHTYGHPWRVRWRMTATADRTTCSRAGMITIGPPGALLPGAPLPGTPPPGRPLPGVVLASPRRR